MFHDRSSKKKLYDSIYMNSKTVWNEHINDKKDAKTTLKSKRGIVQDKGKTLTLHSFLNNILMQLRKSANHPVLIRAFYDDNTISEMAKILKNTSKTIYENCTVNDIEEELKASSDWELHCRCYFNPHISQYQLKREQWTQSSGKFVALSKLLEELKKDNHRVLIFSQMTKMLDIIEAFLDVSNYTYLRLDGSTSVPDRQVLLNQFNSDNNIFIFLLSTRAGGLGVNLTSADTVIFYDISYNPQVDRQAEDRCHRLGQTKIVTIYKLIVMDSCENHILDMATEKKRTK